MYMHRVHALGAAAEIRRRHLNPGNEIKNGCEPLCGRWKLNLGPLPEQQVSLSAKLYLPRAQAFSFLKLGLM